MSLEPLRNGVTWTLLALAALVYGGVSPRQSAAQTDPRPAVVGGACEDARYNSLLGTPLNSMGDLEHKYFVALDEDCRKHKRDQAAAVAASVEAYSPCVHPPYTALVAAKTPALMTDREYRYFVAVDRECATYKNAGGTATPAAAAEPQAQQRMPSLGRQWVTALAVLASLIGTVLASRE